MNEKTEWFESWFDSPYYHSLYKRRDTAEAEAFLAKLIIRLDLDCSGKLLDIACGKGRHSRYFNQRGFDVTGFDISPSSITHNKQFENDRLHFHVHDMRLPFRTEEFDYAVNLFSSFGYFDDDRENMAVLRSAADALKKGGTFIFDYANMPWVFKYSPEKSHESCDGIEFDITRRITPEFVIKRISFSAEGKDFLFEEKLRSFTPERLKEMITAAGLEITATFGDYDLSSFDEANSKRLVIVSVKK